MWKLHSETSDQRSYFNSVTGSKCSTSKVYQDSEGNNWWGFDDLMAIPYTRSFAATKVSSLYALGLSKDDLNNHISGLKTILKSSDPERYEKAYSFVLDFESKASNATDPLKQQSALVPVYYLLNDEEIDSFETGLQLRKMSLLESDPAMHGFFLKSLSEATERLVSTLNKISPTVSPRAKGKLNHSQ